MSDPVTNVEIEDVLTSIRRLVSENDRVPQAEAKTPEPPEKAEDSEPDSDEVLSMDRLVLTPALRVPEANEADEGESSAFSESDDDEGIVEEVYEEEAEFEDVFEAEADDAEDDTEDEALSEASDTDDEGSEISDETLEAPTDFDPDDGIALSEAQALDSRIVNWESLNPNEEDAFYEPDEPGDSDYAGTRTGGLSWIAPASTDEVAPEPDSAATNDTKDDIEDAEIVEDEIPTFRHVGVQTVSLPETGPEPLASSYEDTAEDVVEEAVLAEELDRFEAQVAEDVAAFVTEDIEETIAPELEAFDTDDTMMLDESMLRDLVSDIVRQELQGALGERITRNVRKLVRREIHRALAAHDLDQ